MLHSNTRRRSTLRILGMLSPVLMACGTSTASSPGGIPHRDAGGGTPDSTGGAPSEGDGSAREVPAPPTYMGTMNDAAGCSVQYRTFGFEPVGAGATRHPLFLYFPGTTFSAADQSTLVDSLAARAVTGAMARRGFVALSVEYDNGAIAWLSDHVNQLSCLFESTNAASVLAAACALPEVDCDLGIGTWGHSQGALVADLAANYDVRVRAAWTTGYGGDARASLPRSRFRLVNGEGDTGNAAVPGLDHTAGFALTECPDDGRKECLRTDGSGWIIVQKKDCLVTSADHCWFDKRTCLDSAETLEPNWTDPASTKPFALEASADWVARTARRP
jgi:hypothetical protein